MTYLPLVVPPIFKLTADVIARLIEVQGQACAVSRTKHTTLTSDRDRDGLVRGLVCSPCLSAEDPISRLAREHYLSLPPIYRPTRKE